MVLAMIHWLSEVVILYLEYNHACIKKILGITLSSLSSRLYMLRKASSDSASRRVKSTLAILIQQVLFKELIKLYWSWLIIFIPPPLHVVQSLASIPCSMIFKIIFSDHNYSIVFELPGIAE